INKIRTQPDPTGRFHFKPLILTALLDILDAEAERANSFEYADLEARFIGLIEGIGNPYRTTDFSQPYMRLMNDKDPIQVWLPQGDSGQYTDEKVDNPEWVRSNFPQVQIDETVWPVFRSQQGRDAIRREIQKRWPARPGASEIPTPQPAYSLSQFS